jgi:autotransporter-associated beta strand protein
MMKKKVHKLASAVALVLGGSAASGQVLYEPFDYGIGAATNLSYSAGAAPLNRYSTQGTYWATRGTANADNLRPNSEASGSPTPAYMGGVNGIIPPSFGSNVRSRTTGNAEYSALGLGDYFNAAGPLYWSAVLKPNTIPSTTTGVMIAGILSFALPTGPTVGPPATDGQPGTRQATLWTRQTSATTYQLGLGQNSSASAGVQWSSNITGTTASQFVVVRLNITAGSNNDTMDMWVNPTSNFGSTTAAPNANAQSFLSNTSTADLTDSIPNTATGTPAHSGLFIRSAAGSGNMVFDDIRVDSTWAGVTPDGNKQFTWTGAASGGNLADTTWAKTVGNPDASPNGVGRVANFGTLGAAGTVLNSGAVITTAGETVDSINIRTSNPINIAGSGLTIGSNASAGQIVAYSGGAQIISAPLTLSSNLAVKAASSSTVTLLGAITGAGKTLQKFGQGNVILGAANVLASNVNLDVRSGTLDLGGFAQQADTITLGVGHQNIADGLGGPDNSPGNIINGTLTANTYRLYSGTMNVPMAGGSVIKDRATTVTLTLANTYTGSTTINAGSLAVSNDSNLGTTPGVVTANNINIAGGGTLRILENYTIPVERGITMTGTSPGIISVAANKTAIYPGVVTGTGGLTMTGSQPSVLVLTGNSNYLGSTNVSGTGTAGSGAGGTLRLGIDNALPATTVLGLNGTQSIFDMGAAANAGFNQTIAGIITNGPGGLITNTGTTIKTLTVNGSSASDVNFVIGGNIDLVKSGSGVLTLRGTNTYAGTTVVNSGGAIVVGTLPTNAIPGYTGSLTVNAGGGFGGRLGTDSSISTGDLDAISTNAAVFNGADKHLAIEVTTAGPTANYSSVIADITGSRGVMKYGGGLLDLGGTNTYSGNTFINGGTLQVGSSSNLGDGSGTNNIVVNATSTLKTSAGLGNTTRTVAINTGAVLTFDAGGDTSLSGVISGAGGLTKIGAGTVTLAGDNTYGGNSFFSAGTTLITGNNSAETGNITIDNGAVVRITNSNALGNTTGTTMVRGGSTGSVHLPSSLQLDGTAGNLTIGEPITIEGKTAGNTTPHILNVAGQNAITAPLTMDAAATWFNLQSDSGKVTIAGVNNPTTTGTRNLQLRGAGDGEINGAIQNTVVTTGSVPVTKFDSGTWTLSGPNSYTGNTTINGGILAVYNSGNLGSSTNVIALNGGTLKALGAVASGTRNVSVSAANGTIDSNGFAVTVGNVAGVGNINVAGAGPLTANHFRVNNLTVTGAAKAATIADLTSSASVTPNVSIVNSLVVSGVGAVNLNNSRIITNDAQGNEAGATYDGVQGLVQSLKIFTDQPLAAANQTAIGVATAAESKSLLSGQTTLWSGQTVDDNDTLVMYTWAGDANLDGKVNADDYASIDLYSTVPGSDSWNHGDFNYNGVINADDYALIDNNVQNLNYVPIWTTDALRNLEGGGAATAGLTAVPEPTSIGLLMVSAAGLMSRRRRAK